MLHDDGVFEVFGAAQVASVSVGVHPQEKDVREKWRTEMEKRFNT